MENEIRYVEDELPEDGQRVIFWEVGSPPSLAEEHVGAWVEGEFRARSGRPFSPRLAVGPTRWPAAYAWQPLPAAPPLEKPQVESRGEDEILAALRQIERRLADLGGGCAEVNAGTPAGQEAAGLDDRELAKKVLQCSTPTPGPGWSEEATAWRPCRGTSRPREGCDLCRAAETEAAGSSPNPADWPGGVPTDPRPYFSAHPLTAEEVEHGQSLAARKPTDPEPRFGDRLRECLKAAPWQGTELRGTLRRQEIWSIANAIDQDRDEWARDRFESGRLHERIEAGVLLGQYRGRMEGLERENRAKLQEIVELQANLETAQRELIEREHQLGLAQAGAEELRARLDRAHRACADTENARVVLLDIKRALERHLAEACRERNEAREEAALLKDERVWRRKAEDQRDEARRLLEEQTGIVGKDVADAALVAENRVLLDRVEALTAAARTARAIVAFVLAWEAK